MEVVVSSAAAEPACAGDGLGRGSRSRSWLARVAEGCDIFADALDVKVNDAASKFEIQRRAKSNPPSVVLQSATQWRAPAFNNPPNHYAASWGPPKNGTDNPLPSWASSDTWKQSPSGAWYAVVSTTQKFSMPRCAERCEPVRQRVAAVHPLAEARFLIGLNGDTQGTWTGMFQDREAAYAKVGWGWANGCDSSWVGWVRTEPNWWNGEGNCVMNLNIPEIGLESSEHHLFDSVCSARINASAKAAGRRASLTSGTSRASTARWATRRCRVYGDVPPHVLARSASSAFPWLPAQPTASGASSSTRRSGHSSCSPASKGCCGVEANHQAMRLLHRGNRVETAFECIRGFGALQVAIGHYFSIWSVDTTPGSDFGGGNAVLMFFLMSGFIAMVGRGQRAADGSCCCCSLKGDLLRQHRLLHRMRRLVRTLVLGAPHRAPLAVDSPRDCRLPANPLLRAGAVHRHIKSILPDPLDRCGRGGRRDESPDVGLIGRDQRPAVDAMLSLLLLRALPMHGRQDALQSREAELRHRRRDRILLDHLCRRVVRDGHGQHTALPISTSIRATSCRSTWAWPLARKL